MGITFEKDTLLNWINEMGKYLHLITDKYDHFEDVEEDEMDLQGYTAFFGKSQAEFLQMNQQELKDYASNAIQAEQLRPLAQLLMYDGLIHKDADLLHKAKSLFNFYMQSSGNFAFEDYANLAKIDKALAG